MRANAGVASRARCAQAAVLATAIMKFSRLAVCLAALCAVAPAQVKSQEQLVAMREEKLSKTVFGRAEWTADFAAAKNQAADTGKPILAYFTRSYAQCGPCDAIESGLLSSPEFVEFAKSVVLFVHCTSHVEGDANPHLLREKGFVSYPTLCFMDADGNVTVRAPQRDVPGLAAVASRLGELEQLRELAGEGDEDAIRRLLLCEVELGMLTRVQILERRKNVELDEAEGARIEQALVDLEVRELRTKTRELGVDAVSDKIAELARAGRRPSPDGAQFFWQMALNHAAKNGDAALGQLAFDTLSDQKSPPQLRERNRVLLEQAKAGKK